MWFICFRDANGVEVVWKLCELIINNGTRDLLFCLSKRMSFPGRKHQALSWLLSRVEFSGPERVIRSGHWDFRLAMAETKLNMSCNMKHYFSWEKKFSQHSHS